MPEFIMPHAQHQNFRRLPPLTQAYITAAFFTEHDDASNSKFKSWLDLPAQTLARMVIDCAQFERRARPILADASHRDAADLFSQAGHDFWMSRNGHGCGFWDGDWSEPAGSQLDNIAKSFPEFYLEF